MSISFELSPEQLALREEAAQFVAQYIAPVAAQLDESDVLPDEIWRNMAKPPYQWTGMFIPSEYGGRPRTLLDSCLIIEEVGAASPVCAGLLEGAGLGVSPIITAGTEDQKAKYLRPVAAGEYMACFSLTEPAAGSDAAGIETVATKEGDFYVLNGRKRYASFATRAGYTVVFAKTDPARGGKGVSVFIVEKGTPGFEVVEKVSCMGMRGHQDEEIALTNCRLSKEQLIGQEGRGLLYGLSTLDETRTTLTAGFVGLARSAISEAVRYARERYTFGHALAEYQSISFAIAEAHTLTEAARLLNYRAAWLADQGQRHSSETASAKWLATQAMMKATDTAVTVFGGVGCSKRFPVERFYRDAKIWTFAQGAPNILQLIVARSLLGKYIN